MMKGEVRHPPLPASALVQISNNVAAERDWVSLGPPPRTGRWWTRLGRDDYADVWLLSWPAGMATGLHDHGGSAEAITVVTGRLEHVRADGPAGWTQVDLRSGDSLHVPAGTVYNLRNPNRAAAVTIHAFSPPLSVLAPDRPPVDLVPTQAAVPAPRFALAEKA